MTACFRCNLTRVVHTHFNGGRRIAGVHHSVAHWPRWQRTRVMMLLLLLLVMLMVLLLRLLVMLLLCTGCIVDDCGRLQLHRMRHDLGETVDHADRGHRRRSVGIRIGDDQLNRAGWNGGTKLGVSSKHRSHFTPAMHRETCVCVPCARGVRESRV